MPTATLTQDLLMALDPVEMARAIHLDPDPWQARLLRSVEPRVILNCSRQAGKSTIAALLAVHTALRADESHLFLRHAQGRPHQ